MKHAEIKEWSGILVYVQCYQGKVHPVSMELIGEARRLAAESREPVYAVAAGAGMEAVKMQLSKSSVSRAFLYETEDEYVPGLYEEIVTSCIEGLKPSIVLIGGTYEGRALAPGLSVGFRTGLTADCTGLSIDQDGNLVQTRPAFGGNIMASIVTQSSRPQFATVRQNVMAPLEEEAKIDTEFVIEEVRKEKEDIKIIAVEETKTADDITGQKVLVVAGRGIKKKDDLQMLRELASLLGGKLASSRALVEKGWMSPKEQIGLSGSTVSPEYMITCGVSGTVQFMAGMKNTKNIIAINNDANARIFDIAHYPICQDLYEVVPALIEQWRLRKGDGLSEA